MRLRQGRRVPQHVYLQVGDDPSDIDPPLFTVPSPALAELIVESNNALLSMAPLVQNEFDRAGDQIVVLG